jgi:hypothetical protein
MDVLRGSCLCGAVRFEADLPTLFLCHCHCHWCRVAHGAAFVTWTGVKAEKLRQLGDRPFWYRVVGALGARRLRHVRLSALLPLDLEPGRGPHRRRRPSRRASIASRARTSSSTRRSRGSRSRRASADPGQRSALGPLRGRIRPARDDQNRAVSCEPARRRDEHPVLPEGRTNGRGRASGQIARKRFIPRAFCPRPDAGTARSESNDLHSSSSGRTPAIRARDADTSSPIVPFEGLLSVRSSLRARAALQLTRRASAVGRDLATMNHGAAKRPRNGAVSEPMRHGSAKWPCRARKADVRSCHRVTIRVTMFHGSENRRHSAALSVRAVRPGGECGSAYLGNNTFTSASTSSDGAEPEPDVGVAQHDPRPSRRAGP